MLSAIYILFVQFNANVQLLTNKLIKREEFSYNCI